MDKKVLGNENEILLTLMYEITTLGQFLPESIDAWIVYKAFFIIYVFSAINADWKCVYYTIVLSLLNNQQQKIDKLREKILLMSCGFVFFDYFFVLFYLFLFLSFYCCSFCLASYFKVEKLSVEGLFW